MTTWRTVLEATGGNNVGIVIPDDVVLGFDRGKRVPVIVTIDGQYTYPTTIGVMGGRYLVSFNAETRRRTGPRRRRRGRGRGGGRPGPLRALTCDQWRARDPIA